MTDPKKQFLPVAKRLLPAFATPIVWFRIPESKMLNRLLVADIERYKERDAGVIKSNANGWHSPADFFARSEKSFRVLGAAMRHAVLNAVRRTSPRLEFKSDGIKLQGWINVSCKGAYNTPHDHAMADWSGVYYVQVPETSHPRSGRIEFLDPRTCVSGLTLPGGNYFMPKITVTPSEGDMILFPSYLRHWVYPNEEESNRVSIAFNANVTGYTVSAQEEKEQ